MRLDLKLNGESHDIFSSDIYYHQSCYLSFVHPYIHPTEPKVIDEQEGVAFDTFFHKIRRKIVQEKCAYLLKDVLNDMYSICNDMLMNSLRFSPRTRTKPCDYAVVTLNGCYDGDNSGKEVSKVANNKKQFKENIVLTESNLTDKDANVDDYGSENSLCSNESFDEFDWELSDFDEWMP